jgi:hypothetical protein
MRSTPAFVREKITALLLVIRTNISTTYIFWRVYLSDACSQFSCSLM